MTLFAYTHHLAAPALAEAVKHLIPKASGVVGGGVNYCISVT